MTTKQILDRLIKLAKSPGSYSSPIIVADLVAQENLFSFQEALSNLMLDIAADVKDGQEKLVKELPFVFQRK